MNTIQLLEADDGFLIAVETLIAVGLVIAIFFAYRVLKKHPRLTSHGWNFILWGLVMLLFHSAFDALDTLQLEDLVVDLLNVGDGATFVIGLLLFAYGIYRIAEHGAEQWEV